MLAFVDHDLDHGPRNGKSATMRMCAVSREVHPIDELIRFVVAPTGEVVPDIKRKLPGRGLWLSAARRTVEEAVRRHQFNRGFKSNVRVAQTLAADTEDLLVRSAAEALAMAAKAGRIVAGFGKVEDTISRGQAAALIHASDAAADGVRKLDAILRQKRGKDGESPQIPIVNVLASAELDLALGRSNVIHAALLAGPVSKTFLSRCQLLVRYRMADDDKTANAARNSRA
jgi:uncharacterized protein